MLPRTWHILFVIISLLVAVPVGASTIQWSDGEFNASSWEMTPFLVDGNGGTSSAFQILSGGNPGAFRQITIIVNSAPPYTGIVFYHGFNAAAYNPSIQGALLEVEFSEDAISLPGSAGGQSSGPAIRQNGVVYVTDWYGTTATTWTNHHLTHLTQADFHLYDDPTVHPDFSSSGGEMGFGFFRGNSTYSGGYTTICGIDNWQMILTTDTPSPVEEGSWGRIKNLYR
jgi:hypothetical protein